MALERLGGIARVRELRDLTTRTALARALESQSIVRLARGQVALPGADAARTIAAAAGGVVSHLSAAQHWGWKVKAVPKVPTVTVPRSRRLDGDPGPGQVVYADLLPAEIVGGVTAPVRTVVDCSRFLDFAAALSVADSALRSRLVVQPELVAAAGASPRTGRARAVRVAEAASDLADNPFESCLRAIALDVRGLAVRPQGWVGTVGRVDLVDDRLMIAIEADSWQWHASPQQFRLDLRRYTALARLGWVVVRFDWEQVMHQPEVVRAALADVAAVRTRQFATRNYGSSRS